MENVVGTIRVTIIEDQCEVRDGLAYLIDNTEGFHCTARYGSAEEAWSSFHRELPDVALVDIGLPGASGIDALRVLKERHPQVQFLILTVYKDEDRIFEAMCAGASGYLLKKTPPARLMESLREAVSGGAPMSPEIARRVIELFCHARPPSATDCRLSPQEQTLLRLLVEGHQYKTAAVEMGISIHTISFHMRHVYEKLQVHSKSEAVAKALRDGLIR